MAENVRVVVRCRPMNRREDGMGCKPIIQIKDCAVYLENPTDFSAPSKTFTYDNAYSSNAPTEAIYNDICYSLVENVLEGYNGTIFAYGQTGCGKSHTMQGPDCADPSIIPSSQRGIISRSFDHIFEAISVTTGVQYLALVSYLEIYNENIRDLLNPNELITNLQLKEIPGEGVFVQNLSTRTVHNAKECEELLRLGTKNRVVGATLMNAGSSRSHSIFTISIEQIEMKSKMGAKESGGIKKGKLNLVDLAGSERQNKTGATGDRLKEATKINLSLSALGNVISALVDGKTKHIPYRDSKLTRLLQDSLGGNTKTLMIACISPADYNYDETLSTLRYASRAKNIHNKPRINEDPKDAMLRKYQEEIMELRTLLESSGKVEASEAPFEFDKSKWLEDERAKLRVEYEAETERLKTEHDAQQKEKEELVRDMERLKTEYEKQFKELTHHTAEPNNNTLENTDINENYEKIPVIQQEALNRIEAIKNALIGGERANDVQLKEKRYRKKLAAQRRLSALAQVLSRIEETSDRDLLQEHYSDIQHELKVKTESLKLCRQKVQALEREVSDLQSEFQLDRADYLETIRRLERNLKFYQQLLEKALPILRKDSKYWDPNVIQQESSWNDDLKKWKLPEDSLNRFRLPPAEPQRSIRECTTSLTAPGRLENYMTPYSSTCATATTIRIDDASNIMINNIEHIHGNSGNPSSLATSKMDNHFLSKKLHGTDSTDIADSYFRPKRAVELIHQRKGFSNWRDFTNKNKRLQSGNIQQNWMHLHNGNGIVNGTGCSSSLSSAAAGTNTPQSNNILSSWLPLNNGSIKKAWCGLNGQNLSNDVTTDIMMLPHRMALQSTTSPPIRVKSTGRIIVMGQQRRPRRLKALPINRRSNT